MANEVKTTLSVEFEKLQSNLNEIRSKYLNIGSAVDKVAKSQEDLNRDLLEQKNVIKDIEAEERKLMNLQKKSGIDQSAALKRVRGDLIVAKQEQKNITDEIKKTISAQKESEKAANKGSAVFKRLGSATAGAFAVHSIIRFAKESIKLYNEQAQGEQRLLVALKGRRDIQEGLIRQSKQIQKTTLFGDDEVLAAQSLIAAFTKEEKQIKELTRVTLDFATAKGFDLKSAADLITKTFASSTNSLTRYGIQVEGTAGSSERLTSIINELDKAFEGQAEAAAGVGTGSLIQFQNQVNDLKEEIGKGLLPVLIEMAKTLSEKLNVAQSESLTFWQKLAGFFANTLPSGEAYRAGLIAINDAITDQNLKLAENDKQFQKTYLGFLNYTKAAKETKEVVRELTEEEIDELKKQQKEREKAALEFAKIEKEGMKLVIDAMDEGIEKQRALENLRYKEELIKFKGHKSALEAIEIIHQRNMLQIESDAYMQKIKLDENFQSVVKALLEEKKLKEFGINDEVLKDYKDFSAGIMANAQQNSEDLKQLGWEQLAFEKEVAALKFGIAGALAGGLKNILIASAGDQKKYATFIKVLTEFEIIANGAASIALALKAAMENKANAATFGVAGLIQFATISGVILSVIASSISNLKSAPTPSFAEGTSFVTGKGTSKSDSVPARLSVGERVVTAEDNQTYWNPLEAIKKGTFDKEYFDRKTLIEVAQKAEKTEKENFAQNIADSLGFLAGLDTHDDLYNVRRKIGDSNYWLRSIDTKLGNKGKHIKR